MKDEAMKGWTERRRERGGRRARDKWTTSRPASRSRLRFPFLVSRFPIPDSRFPIPFSSSRFPPPGLRHYRLWLDPHDPETVVHVVYICQSILDDNAPCHRAVL